MESIPPLPPLPQDPLPIPLWRGVAIPVLALVLIGGAFCIYLLSHHPATAPPSLYKGTITVGYTLWPGYVGLYVAKNKGYFAAEGLDVTLKEYPGFNELSQAFIDGEIQMRADLTIDAVEEAYRGFGQKVVIVIDHSNGSDGIISSEAIQSVDEFRGKRVAYEFGTLEEFFLSYALEQHDMTLAEIKSINLGSKEAAEAFVDGRADVAVTYEPYMSEALRTTHGHVVYTSADSPGLITDVITVRNDFIDQHPETVAAFTQAYFDGLAFWLSHPDAANEITGTYLGISGEEVATQLRGIDVLDKKDNQSAFTFAAGFESLYGNMRRLGDFIRGHRYPRAQKFNTDTLVDDSFIYTDFP